MEAEITSYSFIHNGFAMTFGNTNEQEKNVFFRELGNTESLVCSPRIWMSTDCHFVLILVGVKISKQGPWVVGCYYQYLLKIWVEFYTFYSVIYIRCYLSNSHSSCNVTSGAYSGHVSTLHTFQLLI